MATIPSGTKFIGISQSVDTVERKSASLNKATEVYTIEDLSESLTPDLSPIVVDGNSVSVSADANATTQSTAVIKATSANSGIAIVPNGTGAITAQIPDGTTTGGNARGAYAVDLQMQRVDKEGVAGGDYSVVLGGIGNEASTNYSSVIGGERNRAYTSTHATVIGGKFNESTGGYSITGGYDNTATASASISLGYQNNNSGAQSVSLGRGNTITSDNSTISGGQSNTASTGTHATVVGGQGNTSSGQWSISGGFNTVASGQNTVALGYKATASATGAISIANNDGSLTPQASGNWSNVFGGVNSTATNTYATALGGYRNQASGYSSYAFGFRSSAYLRGQLSIGEYFAENGDAQQSILTARKFDDLTTGGTTVLSLDGTGVTNLIIPSGTNRVWNVQVKTVAVVIGTSGTTTGVSVGDTFMENKSILFKKIGGVSSVVNLATDNNFADGGMGTSAMTYTAGASQELALTYQAPSFTGGGSVTVRVVSKVELVEVAY